MKSMNIQKVRVTAIVTLLLVNSFLFGQVQWSGSPNSTGPIHRMGNVGIGTNQIPDSKLDIRCDGIHTPTLFEHMRFSCHRDHYHPIRTSFGGTPELNKMVFGIGGNHFAPPVNVLTLRGDGAVGIGTTNPDAAYRLSVNGSIRAKEIKVESVWSDFVFEADYELMSLSRLRQSIDQNGHLPDIPSAKEVAVNGISVGEMQAKLLQKIEELTLYVLDLNEENELLKKRVASLEN